MKTRILIVHADPVTRKYLEAMGSTQYEVLSVGDVQEGVKVILKNKPEVVLLGLEGGKKDALQLLRYLKHYGSPVPVIVIGNASVGPQQLAAMKFGARSFLEYPVDQDRLNREISKVLQASCDILDTIPTITEEEENSNRTELEKRLNRKMKCVHGKNQVLSHSYILGLNKTRPRIILKCPLRAEYGMPSTIYYPYIRDVCCADPTVCPAVQQFESRHTA